MIVNRCQEDIIEKINLQLTSKIPTEQIYIFPEIKELNTPTLCQVTETLNAKMLMGNDTQLQYLVHGKKIAAMGVENYLSHIENGDVIIVPGDRIDIILASILSTYAKNHSNIAGIILSGGIIPSKSVMDLLQRFFKCCHSTLFCCI